MSDVVENLIFLLPRNFVTLAALVLHKRVMFGPLRSSLLFSSLVLFCFLFICLSRLVWCGQLVRDGATPGETVEGGGERGEVQIEARPRRDSSHSFALLVCVIDGFRQVIFRRRRGQKGRVLCNGEREHDGSIIISVG